MADLMLILRKITKRLVKVKCIYCTKVLVIIIENSSSNNNNNYNKRAVGVIV